MVNDYYVSQKRLLMWGFDWAARRIRHIVVRRYGAETTGALTAQARREYEALIPQLPYIGGRRNPHTRLIIAAAMFLALYRALKRHGEPVEEIGELVHAGVRTFFDIFPRFPLRLYGGLNFTRRTLRRAQKMALESQKRQYPGAWVYTVVEGDGEAFDWGIDQVECGICKFFADQDADEFVPYVCALDFIASDYFGWGLVRTTTLAEGGEHCDFRFKRGSIRRDLS
jgi:hypothetical protein